MSIAIPGEYERADKFEPGDGWWGIRRTGSKFTLEATSTIVSAVPAMYQSPGERPSGVSVRVAEDYEFVAVVRGARFKAGPLIPTRPQKEPWSFLYPGEKRELTLDSGKSPVRFHIWAIGTAIVPEGSPTTGFHDYKLVLVRGSDRDGVRQTLLADETLNVFEKPEIIWAGDLDRDGKPDLIVNRTAGESQIYLMLFLSSAASREELVGLAAQWKALGPC